jgi:hypothetical protein
MLTREEQDAVDLEINRRGLADILRPDNADPTPIACPDCGVQTSRGTVQGGEVPAGAVMGCHCGAVFRVTAGMFGEVLDPKTCSVEDLKLLDKARQEVKRTRRQWETFQRNNREDARRRMGQ